MKIGLDAPASIHSIKTCHLDAYLLKINLTKAFNCVDLEILWMILHKIGLGSSMIIWI